VRFELVNLPAEGTIFKFSVHYEQEFLRNEELKREGNETANNELQVPSFAYRVIHKHFSNEFS
jgi:hypothetical protein